MRGSWLWKECVGGEEGWGVVGDGEGGGKRGGVGWEAEGDLWGEHLNYESTISQACSTGLAHVDIAVVPSFTWLLASQAISYCPTWQHLVDDLTATGYVNLVSKAEFISRHRRPYPHYI